MSDVGLPVMGAGSPTAELAPNDIALGIREEHP
jgi:hypothetical protein